MKDNGHIRIFSGNPRYWQYKGGPTLLLGGSDDDNVFNWPDRDTVRNHIELLARVGGNCDRCVMSARDKGNVKPYKLCENGKYDLSQWNDEYWARFDFYLEQCQKNGVIAQIELWATYDLAGKGSPFDPANHIQEDIAATGFRFDDDGSTTRRRIYRSVPALDHNPALLSYLHAYADEVLRHCFQFDNVLYCIDNEYNFHQPVEWFHYWAGYIREKAKLAGRPVDITEMNQTDWEILLKTRHGRPLSEEDKDRLGRDGDWNCVLTTKHRAVYDRTELFSYIDAGNGMGNSSPTEHWGYLMSIMNYTAEKPRPINNTKLYGADYGGFWPTQEAINKFWRNIFGGCASVRFHRPKTGLGLNGLARASITCAREFERLVEPWNAKPRMDLIEAKGDHDLFVMADDGRVYALLFPGKVLGNEWVKLSKAAGRKYTVRWFNVNTGERRIEIEGVSTGKWLCLIPPDYTIGGTAVAVISAEKK